MPSRTWAAAALTSCASAQQTISKTMASKQWRSSPPIVEFKTHLQPSTYNNDGVLKKENHHSKFRLNITWITDRADFSLKKPTAIIMTPTNRQRPWIFRQPFYLLSTISLAEYSQKETKTLQSPLNHKKVYHSSSKKVIITYWEKRFTLLQNIRSQPWTTQFCIHWARPKWTERTCCKARLSGKGKEKWMSTQLNSSRKNR